VANCYFLVRLNNSPTHKKRPKAYAEPKAAGLRRGGRQISTSGRARTARWPRARVRRLGVGGEGVKISGTGRRRTAAKSRARIREIRVFGKSLPDVSTGTV